MNLASAGADAARPSILSLIQRRHANALVADNSGIADLPSVTMTLTGVAASDAAIDAADALASEISAPSHSDRRPSNEYIVALQAIVADLLIAACHEPLSSCFRPMRAETFKGLRVGYKGCKRAVDDLQRHGYIIVYPGVRPQHGRRGTVTRIVPTDPLVTRLANLGIAPADRLLHFTYGPAAPPPFPIRLKASSGKGFVANKEGRYRYDKIPGDVMAVDQKNPTVLDLMRPVVDLNEYMRGQRISLDRSKLDRKDRNLHLAEQVYFYRGFNNGDDLNHDWRMGGRINAEGGHDVTPAFHPAATRDRPVLSRRSAGEATGGVNPARCRSSSAANAAGVA